MSSFRTKRDAKEKLDRALDAINENMGGTFGVGDTCGAGFQTVAFLGAKSHDQCNAITECKCTSVGVNVFNVCKCALTWWFILIVVLGSIIILSLVVFCIMKALGCCNC